MSPTKRIFLNVAATYGRSLFALVCALFTSRWILMALGAQDFGLYGLVGGIIGFVAFFNSVLSLAVGRFYAFEVGRASAASDREAALEECRAWFSTAVFLHTLLPLVLVAIGWPLGEYAVRHWLTIPSDRLSACVWIFRFSCLSCLVSMMSVPFNAMYTAKQYIAELTIYSVVATTVRVVALYYMVTHPRDWLVGFGILMMAISVVPNLLIAFRASIVFPECRLRRRAMVSIARIRQLGGYAFGELFGMGAWTCRSSGLPVLINEYLGPVYNSSMTIATAISGHANTLASCLTGAFAPAITNACGAGRLDQMREYAFRACKIGTLLTLFFVIPVALELDKIVHLWLKDPPPGTITLTYYVLVMMLIDRLACGHHLAVSAMGKIVRYQIVTSSCIFAFLPVAWLLLVAGLNIHAIGISFILTFIAHNLARVWMTRRLAGMSARSWVTDVVRPVFMVSVGSSLVGTLSIWLLPQSLTRVAVTSIISCVSLMVLSLFFGLNMLERKYLMGRVCGVVFKSRNRQGNHKEISL